MPKTPNPCTPKSEVHDGAETNTLGSSVQVTFNEVPPSKWLPDCGELHFSGAKLTSARTLQRYLFATYCQDTLSAGVCSLQDLAVDPHQTGNDLG